MAEQGNEITFLDEHRRITLTELSRVSGLSVIEIRELVELGAFEVVEAQTGEWVFASRCVYLARAAYRLKSDLDLNLSGTALALTYLERIRELEERLRELECQLPGHR